MAVFAAGDAIWRLNARLARMGEDLATAYRRIESLEGRLELVETWVKDLAGSHTQLLERNER